MFAWKASRSVSRRQPGGVCKLQHSKPWWLGKFDASQPFFIHSILHPGVHPSIPDDSCFCRSCHGFSCLHPFHVSAWFCSCALLPFRCPFFPSSSSSSSRADKESFPPPLSPPPFSTHVYSFFPVTQALFIHPPLYIHLFIRSFSRLALCFNPSTTTISSCC